MSEINRDIIKAVRWYAAQLLLSELPNQLVVTIIEDLGLDESMCNEIEEAARVVARQCITPSLSLKQARERQYDEIDKSPTNNK